jgi:hypothetical protein
MVDIITNPFFFLFAQLTTLNFLNYYYYHAYIVNIMTTVKKKIFVNNSDK